jgi:hypothetical protein
MMLILGSAQPWGSGVQPSNAWGSLFDMGVAKTQVSAASTVVEVEIIRSGDTSFPDSVHYSTSSITAQGSDQGIIEVSE